MVRAKKETVLAFIIPEAAGKRHNDVEPFGVADIARALPRRVANDFLDREEIAPVKGRKVISRIAVRKLGQLPKPLIEG